MTWAVPTSPEKHPSARLRREAEIELRSSARLGSPHNRVGPPPHPRPALSLPLISFLSSLTSRAPPCHDRTVCHAATQPPPPSALDAGAQCLDVPLLRPGLPQGGAPRASPPWPAAPWARLAPQRPRTQRRAQQLPKVVPADLLRPRPVVASAGAPLRSSYSQGPDCFFRT
jgi:hypothetical protein